MRDIVRWWDPVVVNRYLAKWDSNIVPGVTDPFDTRFAVSEIQPTKAMYLVRVYKEPACGPLGSFITRASVIRGRTPSEIRNLLALPYVPTKFVYVKVPAGCRYGLWAGIAGRIHSPGYEWGEGGGEQIKIISKQNCNETPADPEAFAHYTRLPAENYVNAQRLGDRALSYFETVHSGRSPARRRGIQTNTSQIANYLDQHLPEPFSDIEYIYTTLDYIHAASPTELANALNQLSPINFDAYSIVSLRNDLLFAKNMLTQRNLGKWITIADEYGNSSLGAAQGNSIFNYQTTALIGGVNYALSSEVISGIGIGYLQNHLDWRVTSGKAEMRTTKLGLFIHYIPSNYMFNATVIGGFNWNHAQRNIHFKGLGIAVLTDEVSDVLKVSRQAISDQKANTVGLHFTAGKFLQFSSCRLLPTAQLIYFYSRQAGFNEQNADDLNLCVKSFSAHTLRTQVAMTLEKVLYANQTLVNTNVKIGWVREIPLDTRTITASLPALGGRFSVKGMNTVTNELLADMSISINILKKLWIDVQYHSYFSHGFRSQALFVMCKYFLEQ